jgi:HPt (histidine-containing phosphotransfer) domain-containing protein
MLSEPTLNRAPLDELVEVLGAPAALEMIAQVRQTLGRRAKELRDGALEGHGSLRVSAHKLTGLAATFGLEALAEAAAQLEIAETAGDWDDRALDDLDREVGRAIDVLDAYLTEPP